MSQHLPSQPSLEYLKKQARHRLRDLQQQNPSSKFADALHAIAREHGFGPPPDYGFDCYTKRVKAPVFLSRFEAAQFGGGRRTARARARAGGGGAPHRCSRATAPERSEPEI